MIRRIKWEKSGRPTHCMQCVGEGVNVSSRAIPKPPKPVNCPVHGDPRELDERWGFYLSLYNVLYPSSHFLPYTEKGADGKEREVKRGFLNIETLHLACEALDISFRDAWIRLSEIEDAWHG